MKKGRFLSSSTQKGNAFFLHFHKQYYEDFVICIEDFPPGNAGEYDPSFNGFYALTHI